MNKLLTTFAAALLVGCSSAEVQDGGSAITVSVKGSSEDGYIAGAVVWHDVNNNRSLDSGEPSAKTDQDGYFSESSRYNSAGEDVIPTNYCRANAPESDRDHCLQLKVGTGSTDEIIIRTQGGTDILTGQPFIGSISIKTGLNAQGGIEDVVATPITAMLAHMTDAEGLLFAQSEGLSSVAELKKDFLEFTLSNKIGSISDASLMRSALQAHKTIEVMNAVLLKRYPAIGTSGTISDASDFFYDEFTQKFVGYMTDNPDKSLNDFLTNNASIQLTLMFIFNDAEKAVRQQLQADQKTSTEDEYPADELDVVSFTGATALGTEFSEKISGITQSIAATMEIDRFDTDGTFEFNSNNAFAKAKVIEIIKDTVLEHIKTTDNDTIDDIDFTSIDTKFSNVKTLADPTFVSKLETAGSGFYIADFVKSIPTDTVVTDLEEFSSNVSSSTRAPLSALRGYIAKRKLVISKNSETTAGTLLAYFLADDELSNSGNLELCVKFDEDTTSSTAGSVDTEGAFFKGSWKMTANDYVVELTSKIGVSEKGITITSLGLDEFGNRRYSANYDGETAEWAPDQELVPLTDNDIAPSKRAIDSTTAALNNACKTIIAEELSQDR